MFARWRNLAAAAGALCLPFSLALPSIRSEEIHCPRSAASASYNDPEDHDWFRHERDAWYQRYYYNALPITAPATLDPAEPLVDEPQDDPADVIISDIEPIDAWADELTVDIDEPCDEVTCPCHDILADDCAIQEEDADACTDALSSESDERTGEADESSNGASDETTDNDVDTVFLNVYAPYFAANQTDDVPSKLEPTAHLTGTIEPIVEYCDDVWLEAPMSESDEMQDVSSSSSDDAGLDEFESDVFDRPTLEDGFDIEQSIDDESVNDESVGDESTDDSRTPKFHMFYPGCDWSPYFAAPAGNSADA